MQSAEVEGMVTEWDGACAQAKVYSGRSSFSLVVQRREAALTAYRGGTGTLAAVLEARVAMSSRRNSLSLRRSRRPARPGRGWHLLIQWWTNR